MKYWIIKTKILQVMKQASNQTFNIYDISDKIYTSWFGQLLYYKWDDVQRCLDILVKENKICVGKDFYDNNIYSISRRYDYDRFLYK